MVSRRNTNVLLHFGLKQKTFENSLQIGLFLKHNTLRHRETEQNADSTLHFVRYIVILIAMSAQDGDKNCVVFVLLRLLNLSNLLQKNMFVLAGLTWDKL